LDAGYDGGQKNPYDRIKAFSETDFTRDLREFDVPTLILHGDDDQVVPMANSAQYSQKLIRNSQLRVYKGVDHARPVAPQHVLIHALDRRIVKKRPGRSDPEPLVRIAG